MTQSTDTDIKEIRDLILGLDKKIDALDKKVEVNAAKTDERFNAIDQRLGSLEDRFKATDNRIWTLIAGVVLALFGLLAKMTFFPTGQI
jgi:hypothetical protein